MQKKFISIPFASIEGQVKVVGIPSKDKKLVKIVARLQRPVANGSVADEYVSASSTPQAYCLIVGVGAFDVHAEFEGAVSPIQRVTLKRGERAELNFQFDGYLLSAAWSAEDAEGEEEEETVRSLRPFVLN